MPAIDTCVLPVTLTRYRRSRVPFQVPTSTAAGRIRLSVPATSQEVMLAHEIAPRLVPAGTGTVRLAAGWPAELIFTR